MLYRLLSTAKYGLLKRYKFPLFPKQPAISLPTSVKLWNTDVRKRLKYRPGITKLAPITWPLKGPNFSIDTISLLISSYLLQGAIHRIDLGKCLLKITGGGEQGIKPRINTS